MAKKVFITTQVQLAKAVGRSPEHLSSIKHRKYKLKEQLLDKLNSVTGISKYTLLTATPEDLDKEFRSFFKKQEAAKILSYKHEQ